MNCINFAKDHYPPLTHNIRFVDGHSGLSRPHAPRIINYYWPRSVRMIVLSCSAPQAVYQVAESKFEKEHGETRVGCVIKNNYTRFLTTNTYSNTILSLAYNYLLYEIFLIWYPTILFESFRNHPQYRHPPLARPAESHHKEIKHFPPSLRLSHSHSPSLRL